LSNTRLALLSVLVLTGLLQAQTFKGHWIGESTVDFLKAEPTLQAKVTDCQVNAPRELTPEEIRQRYGRRTYEQFQKQAAQYGSSSGTHLAAMDKDPDTYGDKCGALLDALVNGDGLIDGTGYMPNNQYSMNLFKRQLSEQNIYRSMELTKASIKRETNRYDRYFRFQNGLLISLSMSVAATYDSLLEDITKRLGVSPVETAVPYHNAFGARWDKLIAAWDNDKLHAELVQDNNPAEPSLPHVTVQTRTLHLKHLEDKKNGPSPLD
jgi:hypothetical protein